MTLSGEDAEDERPDDDIELVLDEDQTSSVDHQMTKRVGFCLEARFSAALVFGAACACGGDDISAAFATAARPTINSAILRLLWSSSAYSLIPRTVPWTAELSTGALGDHGAS
jgi:hypothetical protein